MKKFYLLFSLLALLMGTSGVKADTVNPYTVDFNTAITTSNHDFAVASNWSHIVATNNYDGYGPYYMSYSYSTDGGVDGSGALTVGAQNGYWTGNTQSQADFTDESGYDYLVTPKVNGTITLKVKSYTVTGYSSYVKIFSVNDAGTTIGNELSTTIEPTLSTSDWSTLTLTLNAASRLAIRAQGVILDNFEATSAEIEAQKAMTITSVKRADSESTTYFDANADGSYNVVYKVKVKNTGEVALTANVTEGYSLSVSIDNVVYGSFNVPVNLAVGEESEEFIATIVVPSSATKEWKYRYLQENLTNTKDNSSLAWSKVITYDPKPFFIKKGDEPNSKGTNLTSVTSLNFGMIGEATTLNYEIFAHNAGNLTIKSITVPEGFAVAPAETLPFTITAHTGMYVDVTANATASASGNMVITYVDKDGNDATMNVALNQTVVDASKWLATFDDNQWPANTIHQSSTRIYNSEYSNITYAVYSQYSYSNKFFTPLLQATDGEEFKFEARLGSSSGSIKVYLTKDRSSLGDPVLTLTNSDLNTSSFVSKSITAAAADNYYVVFEIYSAYIDNLYGFEKVDVDHDIMINSYKIGYYAEDKEIQTGTSQEFNLEVMPANDEAADAYSVKLYANNEVVATADATALTSGTSKTFKMNWTPVVTSTTVFATYAALEFTDGTTIASTPLNLTVKCEPVFVFFNAGTQVYSYQPSNRTTPITFGKVNELNKVQNFEIYNYGKANLTVKSITVPEGFSVNVASATVEPAARQAVDITFSATEIGTYSGDLSIVYVDANGEEQTFTLAVSGTLLNSNWWYANFDDGEGNSVYPEGCVYLTNISLANAGSYSAHNYCATNDINSDNTNNILVTPKLTSGSDGQILSFDARISSSSQTGGTVKLYAAATAEAIVSGEGRTQLFAVSGTTGDADRKELTTDFQTFYVTVEPGTYYIGFEISNKAYVDEIYGLIPEIPDFEIIRGKATYPETAMQNNTAKITAKLQNIGKNGIAGNAYKATITIHKDGTEEREVIEVTDLANIPVIQRITLGEDGPVCASTISVPFKPHLVGENLDILLELDTNDGTEIEHYSGGKITVTEEVASRDVVVGTKSGNSYSYAIIDFFNFESAKTSDIVYTKAQLKNYGVSAGDIIKAITFKGKISDAKSLNTSLTAWVGLKTGDISWNQPDKNTMTEVKLYDGNLAFVKGDNDITITLPTPITYDGTSDLRIYFEGGGNSTYASVYFDYDDSFSNMKWSNNSSMKYNPLMYLSLASEPTIATGTVTPKSSDEGIVGATVTFYNAENDVKYSTKTVAGGKYSVSIIQSGLSYTATVTMDGYLDTVEDVQSFDAANNFKLLTGFILDETAENEDIISKYHNVSVDKVIVNYTAKAGWNTIVLPFEITGLPYTAETKVYELVDYQGGILQFVEHTDKLDANTPYVFYVEDAQTEPMEFEDVAQVIGNKLPDYATPTVSFIGTYSPIPAGGMTVTGWYGVVPSTGRIAKAGSGASIKALRAFFALETNSPAELNAIFTDAENIDTAIEGISIENGQLNINGAVDYSKPVYNLSGQRVGRDYKGVVIQNGKKIVVK